MPTENETNRDNSRAIMAESFWTADGLSEGDVAGKVTPPGVTAPRIEGGTWTGTKRWGKDGALESLGYVNRENFRASECGSTLPLTRLE